ncbi:MAG: universal stress protein [Actinomycetota bacterium]|nr:universal stress protein [Actinomycetota bacterium]
MTERTPNAILVGVDGSLNAGIAAAWAAAIGRRARAPVEAVAAWTDLPPPYTDGVHDLVSEMNTHMTDVATQSLHDAGIDGVEVTAAQGLVVDVLLNAADESDASMLVVGTRGLGPLSGLLLGSISRRLLFTTHRPLVVVPRRSTLNPPELTRVLVGVDCSAVARRVLSWSARFCADLDVPATIVRCASPGCERPPGLIERVDDRVRSDTEEALEEFRGLGVGYTIAIAHCDPRVALVENAASEQVGLIVIGTQGEGQFRGLGGTASYLARHSPVPLAVIP